MYSLFIKNLKLFMLSKPLIWFPVFFIYHLFLSKAISSVGETSNVILAFIMAAALGSSANTYDEKNKVQLLHACLPVRRRDLIYADYLTSGLMLVIALIFSLISSIIISVIFKLGMVMTLPQMLFVLFVLAVQSLFNNPISTKIGSTSKKKIYFIFAILAVFFFCFWLLPLAVYNVFSGFAPLPSSQPYIPVQETIRILADPLNATILMGFAVFCVWLGMALSVKIIEKKDLN